MLHDLAAKARERQRELDRLIEELDRLKDDVAVNRRTLAQFGRGGQQPGPPPAAAIRTQQEYRQNAYGRPAAGGGRVPPGRI